MVSPLRFQDSISIEEYTEQDLAKFAAYLDIQEETEDFYLPLEQELIELIDERIF